MAYLRGHTIKSIPTASQEEYFSQGCGVSRFSYNWGLAKWKEEYEAGNKPNETKLRKLLNQIKSVEFPWMYDVTKSAPQQAIKNLGKAFDRFFKGVGGYPKFKKKGVNDSFRVDNGPASPTESALEVDGKYVKLPKCGWLKLTEEIRFSGRIMSAVVRHKADGWYISFLIETEDRLEAKETNNDIVGVDLGIKSLATLSNGEAIPAHNSMKKSQKKLTRLQRNLSKKKRESNNYAKAKTKLAKLHQKVANQRKDVLHKLTTKLATEFSTVVIEDLNVKGMLRNHKLARAISDVGFGEFRRQLEYKCAMTGAEVIVVDRFFPSTKTCSSCGAIHDMPLDKREMVCYCGNMMDRDLNASINLMNKGRELRGDSLG